MGGGVGWRGAAAAEKTSAKSKNKEKNLDFIRLLVKIGCSGHMTTLQVMEVSCFRGVPPRVSPCSPPLIRISHVLG